MAGIQNSVPKTYIAHRRKLDGKIQTVEEHLLGVAEIASKFADKIGLGLHGELLGLLHDLGKYSHDFQDRINGKRDELVGVDHSTAGAEFIWNALSKTGDFGGVVAQFLAVSIASHHGGIIDCIAPDGDDRFSLRMHKGEALVHLVEAVRHADKKILDRSRQILADPGLTQGLFQKMKEIRIALSEPGKELRFRFAAGLLLRLLFSCLIDADRTDTADFERPDKGRLRSHGVYQSWDVLIGRLDSHLHLLQDRSPIDAIRRQISEECLVAAERPKGIFTLTVPTGGGKTLASLRFALNHARKWKRERIIYVVPFTTIIDQNAHETRDILEGEDEFASVVLEHHSNLTPDEETEKSKILSENWDAPIIYTTMVQILEALFSDGTRSVRRMHQLLNAVIIFDEVQALPIKTVHLFCNALNFLVDHCGSSAVLCTATQPLLNRVDPGKGAATFGPGSEITSDHAGLFKGLKRVEVIDGRRVAGWDNSAVAGLASKMLKDSGSCLVIVNKKDSARSLYEHCKQAERNATVCHLSTSMCPAHRLDKLALIEKRIGRKGNPPEEPGPLICVSTQLIEAGVDVDFGSVIRFLAGIDSIAQAAGRCNRNGRSNAGIVTIVNPAEEDLKFLKEIEVGRDVAKRILCEFADKPETFDSDLIGPKAIQAYFEYYFFERKALMDYPILVERGDTLLNMLSLNGFAADAHKQRNDGKHPENWWRQSFKSAAEAFKPIDTQARGVVAPYEVEGRDLIGQLSAAADPIQVRRLMRRAQRYSVNVFPWVLARLAKEEALHETQEGSGILYVDERFYNNEFGLDIDGESEQAFLGA